MIPGQLEQLSGSEQRKKNEQAFEYCRSGSVVLGKGWTKSLNQLP